MNKETLGVIETVGMAAAIQAADTCVKSANVELIGYELSKGFGLVTIKIRGDVGAVKAAIESAKVSADAINNVYATLIIPRPAENLERLIESKDTVGISVWEAQVKERALKERKGNVEDNMAIEINEDLQNVDQNIEDSKRLEVNEVCNICHNPACTRKKGQSKTLCINYKGTRR